MHKAPLILTLRLDDTSQAFFDEKRREYFPPERNFLSAHLTLFHQLPANEVAIEDDIKNICKQYKCFKLEVSGIKNIGNGVAYTIVSTELQTLHRQLQEQWSNWLISQDKRRLWPHITIQNKVSSDSAASLQQMLNKTFSPFTIMATGLSLYEYQGGPWKFISQFDFAPL